MSNRTANYAAFYVAEPFNESQRPISFIITNLEHGKLLTEPSHLSMLMQKHIMFETIVNGKR